jgi:large subunit ribosomal protein L22
MQFATAKLSSFRMAPRKVRLLAGLIRGKKVTLAQAELAHRAKRAAPIMAKLLASAVANAKALGMNEAALTVAEVRVDKGSMLKRSMPRAYGRAFPIHKHTSHIVIKLAEGIPAVKPADAKETKAVKAPAVKAAKKTVTKEAKVEAPVKKTTKKTK